MSDTPKQTEAMPDMDQPSDYSDKRTASFIPQSDKIRSSVLGAMPNFTKISS